MKTYSNKSNARRAAKAAGYVSFEVVAEGNGFAVVPETCNMVAPEATVVSEVTPQIAPQAGGEVILPPKFKPVAFVHAWLSANTGLARKAAIAALVQQGINFWTARTQYQVWRSNKV